MKKIGLALALLSMTACTVTSETSTSAGSCTPLTAATSVVGTSNVVPITVGCGYVNQPCVSVTVCVPGFTDGAHCGVIHNILLDTGSYGLRLFGCAASAIPLATEQNNSLNVYECVSYLDGTVDWGPIVNADVYMANEKAPHIPVQIISSDSSNVPAQCLSDPGAHLETDPSASGFNGILGVGLQTLDTNPSGGYWDCDNNGNCLGPDNGLTNSQVVANPVAAATANGNNKGVILSFAFGHPNPNTGLSGITGTMTLGINNGGNTNPTGNPTVFQSDGSMNIQTTYSAHTYPAFIDSGSNLLDFPNPTSQTVCSDANASGLYCANFSPNVTMFSTIGNDGTSGAFSFNIVNADSLLSFGNTAYNNIGAYLGPPNSSAEFDWGFPFFLNNTVYVQFAGTNTGASPGFGPSTNGAWAWVPGSWP
jgi:hypothetical protein